MIALEYEVDVLVRGFVSAYGRCAPQAAVAVWLEQTAPAARAVMEAVALRLQRLPGGLHWPRSQSMTTSWRTLRA
ncbi:hypothetical protein [Caulobacter sp. 17J65-9]|uniref:hypothetical protein n=1 Tax=Caulobacter sp. 17J65-9 TaxID=2709382 RepID=UPI0013C6F989|nr:hypothetical protein [Caulobacter sp. 17J65-9]NEX91897.1 hypothetical protein [Caulobacter sp. 17J65-9]